MKEKCIGLNFKIIKYKAVVIGFMNLQNQDDLTLSLSHDDMILSRYPWSTSGSVLDRHPDQYSVDTQSPLQ